MTNKRNVFLSVLLALLMISLPAMASSLDGLTVVSEEPLQYATGFILTHYQDGFTSFTLNAVPDKVYLLVPEGQSAPEGLENNVVVLQKPITRMTFNSTGMVSLVDAIGGLDNIATVAPT